MRFVSRNCIRAGTTLAKPVIGRKGQILLKEGIALTTQYVKKLEEIGVNGVYIHDPLTEDIEVVNTLSEELKITAMQNLHATFSHAVHRNTRVRNDVDKLLVVAGKIVDEILSYGNIMLNLFDLKTYDSYTYTHSINVTVLSVVTATAMGYGKSRLVNLAFGSLMHDIGKIFIVPEIINKVGPLTEAEYDLVKKHAEDGYRFVLSNVDVNISEASSRGILEHHERCDGSGYPAHRTAGRIAESARIIAVADVYDALASDRPYRKGVFPSEAFEYVQGGAGSLFDFEITSAFSRKVATFPVGMSVELSNGAVGVVAENFEGYTQRPRVKILKEEGRAVTPYMLNLSTEALDLTIVAVVS